jgi:hypothetical protein
MELSVIFSRDMSLIAISYPKAFKKYTEPKVPLIDGIFFYLIGFFAGTFKIQILVLKSRIWTSRVTI